jgi:hypothetical protein
LSSFWFVIKWKLTTKEISIFSNSSHLEWRVGLSDTILKGTHPRTIPDRFSVIWFSGFRGEDLNVICYQNMPNWHYRFKSAERNGSSYCLQRTQDKTIVLIKQVLFLIVDIPLLFVSFLETCNVYYNIG